MTCEEHGAGKVKAQRGALLLEQLIAIAILAMVVMSVFNLLVVGSLAGALAQDQSLATHLAQRRLEEIKAAGCDAAASLPRQPVDASQFRGYEWQVDVVDLAPQLKQVAATVYWRARGRERSVSLVTFVRGR